MSGGDMAAPRGDSREDRAVTRRTFLHMAWGTVTVLVTPVRWLADGTDCPGWETLKTGDWSGAPGAARYRIDGLAKVTGQKVYARDFRPRDLCGWPRDGERMAYVLRTTRADRRYRGYSLSCLGDDLQPMRVVDAQQLHRDGVQNLFPDTSPPVPKGETSPRSQGLMVAPGEVPAYRGQPVAILIFRDPATCRAAFRRLQFEDDTVLYGEKVSVPEPLPYQYPTYLTRYVDAEGRERFSQTANGRSNPYDCSDPDALDAHPVDCEAKVYRERIHREIEENKGRGWQVFSSTASTQVLDPMFMEPESGMGWLDRETKTLHLVLGTQAPNGDVSDAVQLFADCYDPEGPFQAVELLSCYPGGGFGGRDTSPFTPLTILAAYYADGPVRIAHDRFTQFQAGLKQLGADVEQTVAVDGEGRFQALHAVQRLQAGGKNNYSQYVAELAGYCAGGGYGWPRVIVDASARPNPSVPAGSMRGFGGPQAAFALETLLDEVAEKMQIDPIELRQRNALGDKDRTITGAPFSDPPRIREILRLAAEDELWVNRGAEKERRAGSKRLYGVGFASANQAFGTGSDGVMAAVELDAEGKLSVLTNAVDMGNGPATTLATTPGPILGANAAAIRMGEVTPFDALRYGKPSSSSKKGRSSPWDDPNYTGSWSMSSSACITAYQQVHAVEQASKILFETGLWPAACRLWGLDPSTSSKGVQWTPDGLVFDGRPPLVLSALARQLHETQGVTAAMVHAYFAGRWVSATFDVGDVTGHWEVDLLATRPAGSGDYRWHRRRKVIPPPPNASNYGRSLYAPSASIIAVEVDRSNGRVRVLDVHTYLNAGRVLQPKLLSGQYEGGVAMGVGYALLENLPISPEGPGSGDWNLNRYHVALAGDLPLDRIRLTTLEPLPGEVRGRGIAEAVLCPIAPAVANAVADATGHRFTSLPITAARILEALGR